MATSTPTFTKTPQAKDDLFASTGLTEDTLAGVKILDVLANDLGSGNTLYSLADGKGESETQQKALLTQDAVGVVNQTALGAKVWITADGKVAYDASALGTSQFQRLAAGESATDSFTYAIKLSNGTLSWATAKVQITGTNDAPVITQNSLTIDGDSSSGKVKGTLLYTDADNGDKHAAAVTLTPLIASVGTPDLSASLAQALHTSVDDEGENGKGALKWDFSLPSSTPKLAAGQTVLANYQLSIADNHGGISIAQDLGFLIVGTGSTPKVYSVASRANLAEQVGKTGSTDLDQTSGVLSAKDFGLEDKGGLTSALVMTSWSAGGAIPSTSATALAAALTTSTVPTSKGGESDKTLAWQFSTQDKTFDFLAAGETLTLAYRVSSAKEQDGKSQVITFTVTGTNDAPVITSSAAAALGPVQEDATFSATGQLSASDADHGATQAWSVQGNSAGTYGSIAVDAAGKWTYTLGNGSAAVQALAAGESRNEAFTVQVADGQGGIASQVVTITVTGTNDAPVITNTPLDSAGAVTEDSSLTASGQLSVSDVDHGATQSWSVQGNATGSYGSIIVDATGKWTYTLANESNVVQALSAGESHDESFTIRVTDDKGAYVDQSVTVNAQGTNDSPVVSGAVTAALSEDSAPSKLSALANASDVDHGTTLSVTGVPQSLPAGVTYDAVTQSFTLDTSGSTYQSMGQGATKNVSVSYGVTDGIATTTATASWAVTGVNDAPIAKNDTNAITATTVASQAHSNVVNWVDWTSATGGGNGAAGTITGTINLGNGQTVGVTYSGEYFFAQTNGGTNFYNLSNGTVPAGTYTSTAVANGPNGSSDIIALNQSTQKTLTFSQPVDNLFFAVVSLNGMDGGVNNGYLFDHNFTIASSGQGYFGSGAATKVALTDGRYELLSTYNATPQLREFHGVVQIDGTVQSLTWTSLAAETWNGFTIGTYGKSLTATASGNVLTNDSDTESDSLAVTSVDGHTIVGNSITLNLASGAEVTVNKDGSYLYDENGAFAALGQGQSAPDTFTYTVSDGHGGTANASVTILVTGVNDAATISLDPGAIQDTSVVEKGATVLGDPTASGKLVVSDVDAGQAMFSVLGSLKGAYGDFTFNSGTGAWTYNLRNSDANVDALKSGDFVTDTLKVSSLDGTAQKDIVVNIAGSNDAIDVVGTKNLFFDDLTQFSAVGIYNGFNFTAKDSYYYPAPYWVALNGAAMNFYAGKYSDMVAANGADFSVDKLNISNSNGVSQVEFKGLNNGVQLYNKAVSLTPTMQTVNLDFANIDDLQIVVTVGSAAPGNYGWWLIDNIWVA